MMLGNPVAGIAEAVGQTREVDRIAQRIAGGTSLGDRRLVEKLRRRPGIGKNECKLLVTPQEYQIAPKTVPRLRRVRACSLLFGRGYAAGYSNRAIDLVAQSNVIDMLGLLTLDWPLLDRWQSAPDRFGETDFRKLRKSGINIFHPAVAFEDAGAYAITRAWFGKWNRLIDRHPAWFLRVDTCTDLARAKAEGKIGIILGMQDANHLRHLDDVERFYNMGQRLTQLTYNSENLLGAGCKAANDRGLTEFGHAVVARMNDHRHGHRRLALRRKNHPRRDRRFEQAGADYAFQLQGAGAAAWRAARPTKRSSRPRVKAA